MSHWFRNLTTVYWYVLCYRFTTYSRCCWISIVGNSIRVYITLGFSLHRGDASCARTVTGNKRQFKKKETVPYIDIKITEITTTLIQGSHLKMNNNYLRTKPMLVCLGGHISLTATCMVAACTQLSCYNFFFMQAICFWNNLKEIQNRTCYALRVWVHPFGP